MSGCPVFKLSDGREIPALGSWNVKSSPNDVYEAVKVAIDTGYRHFDCAYAYENEKEIGRAIADKIKEGTVTREQLWITSKCWNTHHSTPLVLECCQKTLSDLGIEYVDLYLVHWPFGFKEGKEVFPKDAEGTLIGSDVDYLDTWKGMETCHEKGWAKSIGLSNFNSQQIERLSKSAKIQPVMNQVESNPYLTQSKLLDFCKQKGILLTAYCPLARPGARPGEPQLIEDPVITKIAEKHKKTAAQICIRFQIDRGVCVIPKSVTAARIKDNFQVFDFKLDESDLKELEGLNRNYRVCPLMDLINHKFYPFSIEF